MGWLAKLGTWFFGGTSSGTIVEKVDELHLSNEEKMVSDQQDLADARNFLNTPAGPGVFNQTVDGINRLIRPGVTVWLLGGWMGFWKLPAPDVVDPFWAQVTLVVLTFWFGGRVFLKDVPNMLKLIRGIK